MGPYEILVPIGAGGQGEVYKARDTRLERTVAIKVAAAKFSERFEREARAVAALNHPHICTLYDVGPDYLVMEYVEGQPLKGPLPVEKAVEYARQILDALDAAHRQGIVHRDLKPANILVTKHGVKLLDFGLAKAERAKATSASDETVTQSITQEGTILGTLQYMAPEQLQGKGVDARSDLFSFGCVLYEMLTGKRAFERASAPSVIAAVLEHGRGTADDKAQAAAWVATLIRMKREGYKPDRDIILALTAHEEGGGPYNGVAWLLKTHRDLINAEFALNEGGRGTLVNGKRVSNDLQAGEKWYLDLRLEVPQ